MASDRLFEMLAQAKAQPDRWSRAVSAGADAGNNIIGGALQGQDIRQKLEQYRLLNTPLGQMYSDPSQIPFGLSPTHTVKDLLTLAPAMENFAPANLMSGVASQYGANVNPPPGSNRVAAPAQAPAPTIASTSMEPIPGAEPSNPAPLGGTGNQSNPAGPPGTANLNADEGTGAGGGNNVPPGTPTAVVGGPSLNIPPGGMGMGAFKNLVIPALNAAREGRQFQQGQAQTQRNFDTSQANEFARQKNSIQAENNRTMAGETAKIAPSLTEAGTIQDDINALVPLFKNYQPIPFAGTALANLTAKSGSSTFGTPTMQIGKQIEQITPALSAKVNYLLNKRFNSGESAMLQSKVVPNASDDGPNAMQKIANLQRLNAVMQGGDIQALRMVASSIAGQTVNPILPNSSGGTAPTQAPSNSTTPPSQIMTVRTSDGVLHKIPASNIGRVKQRDPGAQVIQ